MAEPLSGESERDFRGVVEIVVRLAVLFAVVAWCLQIIAPFVGIVLWAVIIAVALDTPYERLSGVLGDRKRLAAAIFVLLSLAMLIVPAVLLSETLVDGAQRFASEVSAGTFSVPPPPQKVEDWPIVGDKVYEFWQLANQNLGEALSRMGPQLQTLSKSLLGAAGAVGVAMLQLAASLILAGILLARSKGSAKILERLSVRLAGPRGPEFVEISRATVQSVVQGIVGVAVIQALLGGIGFIAADVPAAGLWALLVLIAAIVQIPVALVMIVPIILVFGAESNTVAAVFAIWSIVVASLDNVLKPLLFGRGVKLPTVVIFLGAIGGMLTMGIIGLFLGAVVLAVGYKILAAWIGEEGEAEDDAAAALEAEPAEV